MMSLLPLCSNVEWIVARVAQGEKIPFSERVLYDYAMSLYQVVVSLKTNTKEKLKDAKVDHIHTIHTIH